jgi:hypothetical protein
VTDADTSNGRLAAALTLGAACYGVIMGLWWGTEFGGGLAYAIFAQSIVPSAILFVVLRAYCTTGRRWLSLLASAIALLFLAWSVVGALSLAAGAMPAACLLVAAVALTPRGQPSPERSVSCSASRLV